MTYPHIQYFGPAYPDHSTQHHAVTRELDSRVSDGIHVRLLWNAEDGRVSVAVKDDKTGEEFELVVPSGEPALDVFHHPYAYAAARRDDRAVPASSAA